MSPLDVLVRFLRSTALAFVTWYILVVLVEFVLPGFATPFVDIADLSVLALVCIMGGVALTVPSSSKGKTALTIAFILFGAGVSGALLWFSLGDVGWRNVLLVSSFIITVFLMLYAIFIQRSTDNE